MSDTQQGSVPSLHLRERAALRTVRIWCDEMARQEAQNDEFHTLIAIDPDVIYMGAFPVENLALGSVFHDYGYLRSAASQVDEATVAGDHALRATALMRIFGDASLRVPLLTTIALSSFIFDRRVRSEPLQAYAVLRPHVLEWEHAQKRARDDAHRLNHALSKHVDADRIREIVEHARSEGLDVAEQLIDRLPETASALFPAQLAPDYAIGSLFRWKLGGVIRPYDKFEGLPRLSSRPAAGAAGGPFDDFMELFEADLNTSGAMGQSNDIDKQRAIKRVHHRISADAEVLAFLKTVHDERPMARMPGREPRPLRVILLTASARTWRVARRTGLASDCLRSPIAYLSDGDFFEWAFEGTAPTNEEEGQLLQRLRTGMLSQWLTPLTDAPSADASVAEAHQKAVHQWERLMSNMATSLSLASPAGELRNAILHVADQEQTYASPEQIAALLQHKIVDAANRLTQYASGAGLVAIANGDPTLRNLPPVDLREYPSAQVLLLNIANADLANDGTRLALLNRIMGLSVPNVTPLLAERVAAYTRSILISLLWFRLQHWPTSHEVAGQAAAYALQQARGDEGADALAGTSEVRGEEALYLVAVTGRLCAGSLKELELPRMALDLLHEVAVEETRMLRTQAERQSLLVAELLLSAEESAYPPPTALMQYRLTGLLRNAVDLMMSPAWRRVVSIAVAAGDDVADVGNRDYGAYIARYALQQLQCAIGVLFLLATEASSDVSDITSSLWSIATEFEKTASRPIDPTQLAFGVVDSRVAQPIRQLMQWTLRRQGGGADATADRKLEGQMKILRSIVRAVPNALSPLDRLRLQRLLQFYDSQD
jgi:hypothetical protein